jgi:hypothetical protein
MEYCHILSASTELKQRFFLDSFRPFLNLESFGLSNAIHSSNHSVVALSEVDLLYQRT